MEVEREQAGDGCSYKKATEGVLVGLHCSFLTGGWYSNLPKGQTCVELNAHMWNWGNLRLVDCNSVASGGTGQSVQDTLSVRS